MDITQEALALYIKVEDGAPVDHPVFPGNLIQVFGEIPSNYEPFMRFHTDHRVPLKLFEVWDTDAPAYAKVNDVWTDTYARREMTPEERAVKEAEIRQDVEACKVSMKSIAESKKAEATYPDEIAMWDAFMATVDAYVITDYENLQLPVLPTPTKRNSEGQIVTVNDSGTAPNVIG